MGATILLADMDDQTLKKLSLGSLEGNGRAKPTLLVVDDEEGPRQSLKVVFQNEYEVILASSPEEAMAMAKIRSIDAAVLDLRMGQTSGMELLQILKEINPLIEVILLTAFGNEETICQALRFGACDFITKPFNLREMRDAVSKAMQRHTLNEHIQERQNRLQILEKHFKSQGDSDPVPALLGQEAHFRGLFVAHAFFSQMLYENQSSEVERVTRAVKEVEKSLSHCFEPVLAHQADWLLNLCRWSHAQITQYLVPLEREMRQVNRAPLQGILAPRFSMLLWHYWFVQWLQNFYIPEGSSVEWEWNEVRPEAGAFDRIYLDGPQSRSIRSPFFHPNLRRVEVVWRMATMKAGMVEDWGGGVERQGIEGDCEMALRAMKRLNHSMGTAIYIAQREQFPAELRLFLPCERVATDPLSRPA